MDASIVWTGNEVIVWGGAAAGGVPIGDGAAYDRDSDTWRPIAEAPIARYSAQTVWTGREMLVWGGLAAPIEELASGAAYDPASDTWRLLPEGPVPNRAAATAVWTGTEMIVWGGYGDFRSDGAAQGSAEGAAYDPATDTWRRIADAPLEPRFYHGATWTGERMIVWGGTSGWIGDGHEFADGAGYDPVTDSWSVLPDAGIGPRADALVIWTGQEVLVLGGGAFNLPQTFYGAAYDPAEGTWRPIEAPRDHYGIAVWNGEQLIAYDVTTASGDTYDPATDTWAGLARHVPAISNPEAVAMDEQVLLWNGDVPGGWVYDPRSMPSSNQPDVSPASRTPAEDTSPTAPSSAAVPEVVTASIADAPVVECPGSNPPFTADTLPEDWETFPLAGPGGGLIPGWPAMAHWGMTDAWIDLHEGESPYGLPEAGRDIEVLGGQGWIFDTADGAAVEFVPTEGCGRWSLVATGLGVDDLQRFIEGLRPVPPQWPAWRPPNPSVPDAPAAVALRFARDVLGWQDPVAASEDDWDDGRYSTQLRPRPGGQALEVVVAALGFELSQWAVVRVTQLGSDIGPGFGSQVRGSTAVITDDHHTFPGAVSADVTLRLGEHTFVGDPVTEQVPSWDIELGSAAQAQLPGSLLIKYFDDTGNVVGAEGTGLAPGELTRSPG